MRIQELPGTVIPPHYHPVDENLTVVQGTIYFGTGNPSDSTALRELGPGSYAFLPVGPTMFGRMPEGGVCTGWGPSPSTGSTA
jgi:quercetin dioxygenase-like cupin family protein